MESRKQYEKRAKLKALFFLWQRLNEGMLEPLRIAAPHEIGTQGPCHPAAIARRPAPATG